MTRDEIMALAREAGFTIEGPHICTEDRDGIIGEEFNRFAALVAAAEREACAKQVEPKGPRPCKCVSCDGLEFCGSIKVSAAEEWDSKTECAAAIRARGEK